MSFAFLIPVAKLALRVVLGEVLSAEKIFGAGKGAEKLEEAGSKTVEALSGSFSLEKVLGALDEIKELINAVVDLLNALGLLDAEPGLDVDYSALVAAVKRTFSAVAQLVEALQ